MASAVKAGYEKATIPQEEVYIPKGESQIARTWRRYRRQKRGIVGLVILGLMLLWVTLTPILSPFDYLDQNALQIFAPAGTMSVEAGIAVKEGHTYWLGTDHWGRDVLTRLSFGGRVTLASAIISTLLVVLLGSVLGVTVGFMGGIVDSIFMRLTDLLLAFPLLPTFLLLTRVFPIGAQFSGAGPGAGPADLFQTVDQAIAAAYGYALIFVALGWMPISRQVRASVLYLRSLDFIEAARALGAGSRHIITRHLVPNAVGPIVLAGVLTVGDFIIYESILSYLGMGVGHPVPSWGNLIRDAQSQIWFVTTTLNPTENIRGFLLIIPGLLVVLTVLSINLIGDALRDALSPE